MANGKIETYEESARAIALWLKEFKDEDKPYPEMIACAARNAAKEIERLRCQDANVYGNSIKFREWLTSLNIEWKPNDQFTLLVNYTGDLFRLGEAWGKYERDNNPKYKNNQPK